VSAVRAVRACRLADLAEAVPLRVTVGGSAVAVVRLGERVHAIGDRCSHAEVSLAEGEVDAAACALVCPRHGSAFDLATGEPSTLPATRPVPVYGVEVRDGEVWLSAPASSGASSPAASGASGGPR
jgi:3-phenylpropionate/trans-cinnamate dioxygenase ferredoxin subunit